MYSSKLLAVVLLVLLPLVLGDIAQDSFPDKVQFDDFIASLTVDGDSDNVGPSIRKVRQAPTPITTKAPPFPKGDLNLAEDVSEDYPVIFTMILFLSIALILALIAISVALSTMDPGKDSLIYRVTSAQRFKKDN